MKPDLSDRKSFQMPFHISARDMDRFAELSLDTNSIHMKDESAIEKGFQSRVVYGGLLVSVISRFIGTQFPGEGWVWHDLSIQFRSPLYIDQHAVLNATIDYLNAQIAAGAQAVQLFDSWVGCLSPEDFRQYVFPHTKRLIKAIRPGVPVISFGTQTGGLLPMFKEAGGDVIGVDWRIELDEAWDILGDVAIMGNLDPVVLFSNPKEIRMRVQRILNQAAGRPGHIFNLGHGILPETPIENVLSLIESVRELSSRR
jgi:hypothetical protein